MKRLTCLLLCCVILFSASAPLIGPVYADEVIPAAEAIEESEGEPILETEEDLPPEEEPDDPGFPGNTDIPGEEPGTDPVDPTVPGDPGEPGEEPDPDPVDPVVPDDPEEPGEEPEPDPADPDLPPEDIGEDLSEIQSVTGGYAYLIITTNEMVFFRSETVYTSGETYDLTIHGTSYSGTVYNNVESTPMSYPSAWYGRISSVTRAYALDPINRRACAAGSATLHRLLNSTRRISIPLKQKT